MKRPLTLALLGISLALGWWALDMRSKSLRNEQEMAELRRARDAAAAAAEKSRSELTPLEENVARLTRERDSARQGAAVTTPSGVGPMEKGNDPKGLTIPSFEAMPPGVRVASASALNASLSPMYRKDYAPLLKSWNLTATELDTVVNLLPSLEMGSVDYVMTHPEAAKLKPEEWSAAVAKLGQDTREHLKSVLGPERVAELDNFKTELKVNKVVGPYAEQLDVAGSPLTPDQKVKLADALSVVRPEPVPNGPGPIASDILRKRNEDRQAKIIQAATGFLTPDQINGLQSVFREQNRQQEAASKVIDEVLKAGDGENSK